MPYSGPPIYNYSPEERGIRTAVVFCQHLDLTLNEAATDLQRRWPAARDLAKEEWQKAHVVQICQVEEDRKRELEALIEAYNPFREAADSAHQSWVLAETHEVRVHRRHREAHNTYARLVRQNVRGERCTLDDEIQAAWWELLDASVEAEKATKVKVHWANQKNMCLEAVVVEYGRMSKAQRDLYKRIEDRMAELVAMWQEKENLFDDMEYLVHLGPTMESETAIEWPPTILVREPIHPELRRFCEYIELSLAMLSVPEAL